MAAKIEKDARYSIRLEWCGKPKQQYVVRFCGEFVGSHATKSEAVKAATAHNHARTSARQLGEFTRGYMTALLWSSTDTTDEGESINLDDYELSTAGGDKCRADCLAFFGANYADLCTYAEQRNANGTPWEYAGHDFALTRNGHGTGFWDRSELDEATARRLTKASEAAGSSDPYLGDDGTVYVL